MKSNTRSQITYLFLSFLGTRLLVKEQQYSCCSKLNKTTLPLDCKNGDGDSRSNSRQKRSVCFLRFLARWTRTYQHKLLGNPRRSLRHPIGCRSFPSAVDAANDNLCLFKLPNRAFPTLVSARLKSSCHLCFYFYPSTDTVKK